MKRLLFILLFVFLFSGCTNLNVMPLPLADQGETVSVNDYFVEVGRGGIGDAILWNKFGYNDDIDVATSPEVIRSWGGVMDFNVTGQTMNLVSSDAADTAGGSGLQSAIIFGVNDSWDHVIEVIAMNGTTPVTTSNKYIGVNRLTIFLSGDSDANVGTITATNSVTGVTMAEMPADKGTSQQCMFYVGEDKRFEAFWLYINAIKTTGGSQPELDIEFWVYSDVVSSKFEVFRGFLDVGADPNLEVAPNQIPFDIGEKSIVWIEASTDTNNARATCRFSGVLVDDE